LTNGMLRTIGDWKQQQQQQHVTCVGCDYCDTCSSSLCE